MSTQENKYTCIEPTYIDSYFSNNLKEIFDIFTQADYELFDNEKVSTGWDSKYKFDPADLFSYFPEFASIVIENNIDLRNPNFSSLKDKDKRTTLEFYNEISKVILFFQNSYRKQQKLSENES